MKNYIKYFYNIAPNSIFQNDSDYLFEYDGYDYKLIKFEQDLNYLNGIYEFSKQLNQLGIYCHNIVLNSEQKLYTVIDNKNYILMVSQKGLNRKITLEDIINFKYNVENVKFGATNWKKLWELKIDYCEYQMNQFGYKYPNLRKSFSYFSGYVELAVALLNLISKYNVSFLSHKRINNDDTLYDFYNPFNLVIDSRVRDAAEYCKNRIFENEFISDIKTVFGIMKFSGDEYLLFFIRILYPSFYFDEFERVINNDLTDDEISTLTDNLYEYEKNIKDLYNFMSTVTNMPLIDWLVQ